MTCQAQERVRAITGDQPSVGEFTVAKFRTKLEKFLGNDVQIVAMRLPFGCAALWTGMTATDRFAFNLYWPVRAVELIAHAVGHLLLGHCGQVRDGGQLACILTDPRELDRVEQGRIADLLSETDCGPERLFDDEAEQAAEEFAARLMDRIGQVRTLVREGTRPVFTCVG